MRKVLSILAWIGVAALGAAAFGIIALHRGETINAAWLLAAALCTYAVAYRFYSKFLARRVLGLDDTRVDWRARHRRGRGAGGHQAHPVHGATGRRAAGD